MAQTLGGTVRGARKRLGGAGITQAELAARLDVSTSYVCDIERGRRTSGRPQLIERLAEALDLPSDYLHYLAGRVPPDLLGRISEAAWLHTLKSLRRSLAAQ